MMPYASKYQAHTDEYREYERQRKYKSRYGLTYDEAQAMKAEGCAICGATEDMVIDHDHETKKVRAALCRWCNLRVGDMNVEQATAVLAYLIQHEEVFK